MAEPASIDRLSTPFESSISSHVLASPAASDRSEENHAGHSPRPDAPSADPMSNGSLKKIACSRTETVESLTAKVCPPTLPREATSDEHTVALRMALVKCAALFLPCKAGKCRASHSGR
jgi:hypothetical protein